MPVSVITLVAMGRQWSRTSRWTITVTFRQQALNPSVTETRPEAMT